MHNAYDENANGRRLIDAALVRAKAENKRVLVTWGANWCGWCSQLEGVCHYNKDVRALIDSHYVPVLIDMGDRDKHMDLAREYSLNFHELKIAHLTVLDAEGKVIAQSQPKPLISTFADGERRFDPELLQAFLSENAD